MTYMTEAQWKELDEKGFVRLGHLLNQEELAGLRDRIDRIMLGEIRYPGMYFQLDSETGNYGDVDSGGKWEKPTLSYRKIQDLEKDDRFLTFIQHPAFREITQRVYGNNVSIFRAMFMNKPAHMGTVLPYHQDAGTQWHLTRDPKITVWTALDPATRANGCMQIIPGSHKLGLLSSHGHTITPEQEMEYCPESKSVYLEAEAGESILLDNLLLHRSGVNKTDIPRRALSVCYMDSATRSTAGREERYPKVFGEAALEPGWCRSEVST